MLYALCQKVKEVKNFDGLYLDFASQLEKIAKENLS